MEGKATQKKGHGTPKQLTFLQTLKRSSLMFVSILPMLLGIVGLVGVMQIYVTTEMVTAYFSGNPIGDTLIGTISAAAASGNPVMSYVVGGELLEKGISFYAVAAFILSWVTLGFVHLPAEAEIFGLRFTVWRNILTLVGTLGVALATAFTMQVLG